ncbi:DUF6151 family protein [Veronia pacifica]|uniref:DUF6151 family protein n=1 Tax=Veronia pacifica TaxID=1080227 RepID=UPI00248029BC|nr:DUF6151 family protein [Veronia pacifica]
MTGQEHVHCVRLSPKGMYRWFTACCHTPLANSIPGFPFVGVFDHVFNDKQALSNTAGPVLGAVHTRRAVGPIPESMKERHELTLIAGTLKKLLRWKLHGLTHPNPFHKKGGQALALPEILSQ